MQSGKRQYMAGSGYRICLDYMLAQLFLAAYRKRRKYRQLIPVETHIPIPCNHLITAVRSLLTKSRGTVTTNSAPMSGMYISGSADSLSEKITGIIEFIRISIIHRWKQTGINQQPVPSFQRICRRIFREIK